MLLESVPHVAFCELRPFQYLEKPRLVLHSARLEGRLCVGFIYGTKSVESKKKYLTIDDT